jgi:non-specific serine/threonine protein kinase
MQEEISFGVWLHQQRRALDFSLRAFAEQVGCAEVTLRRIEAGTLKPSKELASILLEKLGIPESERLQWISFARGLSNIPHPLSSRSDKPITNLPTSLTTFIGREKEQSDIIRLLIKHRLVTLTGSGGVGKTRLSIKVGEQVLANYTDGVWLVELAPILDPLLVPRITAIALGLRDEPQLPITDMLSDYLREKKMLVILDNCEHLQDACAQLVDPLLKRCTGLKILATGREPLGNMGEALYRVPSLVLPDMQQLISTFRDFESVKLFEERAQLARFNFSLTLENASSVAQICHRLDGIPLAIELAAAKVTVFSPEQIAKRLDESFNLLTTRSPTELPHHHTLRATMEWSYDLLTEPEQRLFCRVSVFVGGFILEAAEEICGDDGLNRNDILELLGHLVDKSLVNAEQGSPTAGTRYRILETIRQYGLEKLREVGEESQIHTQHLEYFLQLAEQAEPKLLTSEQEITLTELDAEYGNLSSALEWAMKNNPVRALQLATALSQFWEVRGYIGQGRIAIERALRQAQGAPKELRAKGLLCDAHMADRQGDYARAKASVEESLDMWREMGDKKGIADSLRVLGSVVWVQGDYVAAQNYYEECLALLQEIGDKRGIASTLNNLGNAVVRTGDYAAARRYEEESVAIFRELGDNLSLAMALNNLGVVAEEQGDSNAARRFYEESISISRELGEKTFVVYALNGLAHVICLQGDLINAWRYYRESLVISQEIGEKRIIAYCLEGFAKVAARQGNTKNATQLFGAADALRQAIGAPLDPAERAELDQDVIAARNQLGEKNFELTWAEGRVMTMEQAIEFALKETHFE